MKEIFMISILNDRILLSRGARTFWDNWKKASTTTFDAEIL
jgi:hypothetical protein